MRESPELKTLAATAELVMGGKHRQRLLKRGTNHGKLDLLAVQWIPRGGEGTKERLVVDRPQWDTSKFGDACAGCHASGVDATSRSFTAISLDCFVCHGEIPEDHTVKPETAIFSKNGTREPRVVVSICGQCHLRNGKSRSTGLPYANNFVAGDNLFRDFQVDFSDEQRRRSNPADAHILENVRDVVLLGKSDVTCVSCHTVHKPSGSKHHRVREGGLCANCHLPGSKTNRIDYEVHSLRCEY
jgi:hypothetical protein